jgi:hypothetical protein
MVIFTFGGIRFRQCILRTYITLHVGEEGGRWGFAYLAYTVVGTIFDRPIGDLAHGKDR